MKIIFDSENQKKEFMECIAIDYCPSSFGLKDKYDINCHNSEERCRRCWRRAIEMEVRSGT